MSANSNKLPNISAHERYIDAEGQWTAPVSLDLIAPALQKLEARSKECLESVG